ncbi:hypothetical protein [Bradyrhizobium elkanii]|uniref:hypothetical protein n=1 Tax=Bradyrhizobium elkanii TaxID=29448 RepID=UPI0027299CA6|nr:hypothetical protein [Bradyrhizobium elkanii]WLA80254.1 hypothetical protein QNJ99_33440 [Bradyrhizobium elkanii]
MRTVRVRIAVAVDPKGRWYAQGSGEGHELLYPTNHDQLLETRLFWLTAELLVPQIETVAAEASLEQARKEG